MKKDIEVCSCDVCGESEEVEKDDEPTGLIGFTIDWGTDELCGPDCWVEKHICDHCLEEANKAKQEKEKKRAGQT